MREAQLGKRVGEVGGDPSLGLNRGAVRGIVREQQASGPSVPHGAGGADPATLAVQRRVDGAARQRESVPAILHRDEGIRGQLPAGASIVVAFRNPIEPIDHSGAW